MYIYIYIYMCVYIVHDQCVVERNELYCSTILLWQADSAGGGLYTYAIIYIYFTSIASVKENEDYCSISILCVTRLSLSLSVSLSLSLSLSLSCCLSRAHVLSLSHSPSLSFIHQSSSAGRQRGR